MNGSAVLQAPSLLPENTLVVEATTEIINTPPYRETSREADAREGQTAWVFNHPTMVEATKGKMTMKERFLVSLGINLANDWYQRGEKRNQVERIVTLSWFARLFSKPQEEAVAAPVAATTTAEPKTFWDRLNGPVMLPLVVCLMVGAASFKTGEVTSLQHVSDSSVKLTDSLQKQVDSLTKDKDKLTDKNDQLIAKNDSLQSEMKEMLATEAQDSQANAKTIMDRVAQILAKNAKTAATKAPPPAVQ